MSGKASHVLAADVHALVARDAIEGCRGIAHNLMRYTNTIGHKPMHGVPQSCYTLNGVLLFLSSTIADKQQVSDDGGVRLAVCELLSGANFGTSPNLVEYLKNKASRAKRKGSGSYKWPSANDCRSVGIQLITSKGKAHAQKRKREDSEEEDEQEVVSVGARMAQNSQVCEEVERSGDGIISGIAALLQEKMDANRDLPISVKVSDIEYRYIGGLALLIFEQPDFRERDQMQLKVDVFNSNKGARTVADNNNIPYAEEKVGEFVIDPLSCQCFWI